MPISSFNPVRIALLPVILLAFAASPADARKKKPSEYAPVMAPEAPPPPAANGAIFQVSQGYAPLTSGNRAASVGDLVTIILAERTQATKTATQGINRESDIGLTPPGTGPLSLFKPSDVEMGGGTAFNGKGQASQSNALQGEITVTIAAVYPNGTMLVRGEKLVRLNRGDEFIQLSGLIRPADISSDNRVFSSRVADAKITYSGKGEVARASRQGWLQRFFTMLSPF